MKWCPSFFYHQTYLCVDLLEQDILHYDVVNWLVRGVSNAFVPLQLCLPTLGILHLNIELMFSLSLKRHYIDTTEYFIDNSNTSKIYLRNHLDEMHYEVKKDKLYFKMLLQVFQYIALVI